MRELPHIQWRDSPVHCVLLFDTVMGNGLPYFILTSLCDYFQDGVLTGELIQHGLSDLGRTGDGTKLAYLTLNLPVRLKTP